MNNRSTKITSYITNVPSALVNMANDWLSNSNFLTRTIGNNSSYSDLTSIINNIGHNPESLLVKDYIFLRDHVFRNYLNGAMIPSYYFPEYCAKFTFYNSEDVPDIHFADVDRDPQYLINKWFPDMEFGTTLDVETLYSYGESRDGNATPQTVTGDTYNNGIRYGHVESLALRDDTCDLLNKTNYMFQQGWNDTLIARFHSTNYPDTQKSPIQTAISNQYGLSHGRNLLKKSPSDSNGYDNPYCRVWTYHHQYNKLSRAIRPFGSEYDTQQKIEKGMASCYDHLTFRTQADSDFGTMGGSKRLDEYGVLNYDNGMVRIAPTAKLVDYFNDKVDGRNSAKNYSVKKCMFSIENLAWKADNIAHNEYDEYGLSPEQKGPFGGRIMWFPPYDLKFNESTNVQWNKNDFIGRGESVYTYTNSDRGGNLSFTLLIDHPAILDYWTGRDENGKQNNCKDLGSNNTGGVDDLTQFAEGNQEQTLLRFFAGCVNGGNEKEGDENGGTCGDIITAKMQKYYKKKHIAATPVTPKEPDPETAPKVEKKILHCVLYYPNNYSGADDAPINDNAKVNAIYYLMQGVGTQKCINEDTKLAEDFPVEPNSKFIVNSKVRSGYELGDNISVTTNPLKADYNIIKKSFADLKSNERKGQYLTDENGNVIEATYEGLTGGTKYKLAKIIGSKALSLSQAKVSSNLNNKPHEWYRRRWYYRVDTAYENDRLSNKNSYIDEQTFSLNGSGYKKVLDNKEVASAFGLDDAESTSGNTLLVSFADMFQALETSAGLDSSQYTQSNVDKIKEIVENKDNRYSITSIKFEGHASHQGYNSSNNTLAQNRCLTFKKWMQSVNFPSIENASSGVQNETENAKYDVGENSTLLTKLWRSASMIIEYEQTEMDETSKDVNIEKNVDVSTSITASETSKEISSIDSKKNSKLSVINGRIVEDPYISTLQQNIIDDYNDKVNKKLAETAEKAMSALTAEHDVIQEHTVERYDNEGEFFEELSIHDPFLHHLIKDKIKYFDPAFHSISPEGFNARLTFLNQCTRQGSTTDNSSNNFNSTAYNLAFGRPPICVLRLGDFYYTKIIITSLNIQYDDAQWDLNPEGIGVMPMFAKVNIQFKFLGGSDLSGPIARLQNAVSFNYYANTGVYDNRAEMVEYDTDGSGKETHFKPYVYPDMVYNGKDIAGRKLKGTVEFDKNVVSDATLYNNDNSSTSTYTTSEYGNLTEGRTFTRKSTSANTAIKTEKNSTQWLTIDDF